MKKILISALTLLLSYNSLAKDNSAVYDRANEAFPTEGTWEGFQFDRVGRRGFPCKIAVRKSIGKLTISLTQKTNNGTVTFHKDILENIPEFIISDFNSSQTGNDYVSFTENNTKIRSTSFLSRKLGKGYSQEDLMEVVYSHRVGVQYTSSFRCLVRLN